MITKLFSSNFLDDYAKEHDEFPKQVRVRCQSRAEMYICMEYLKQKGYMIISSCITPTLMEVRALRDPFHAFSERVLRTQDAIDMSKNFMLLFYDDMTDASKKLCLGDCLRVETDTILHGFIEHALMEYHTYIREVGSDMVERKENALSVIKGYNEFTKDCDAYLLPQYADMVEEFNAGTYLHNRGVPVRSAKDKPDTMVIFRVPGATRGHLVIENDLVKAISFYDDTCFDMRIGCYDPKIKDEIPKKWIGKEWKVPYIGGYPNDSVKSN